MVDYNKYVSRYFNVSEPDNKLVYFSPVEYSDFKKSELLRSHSVYRERSKSIVSAPVDSPFVEIGFNKPLQSIPEKFKSDVLNFIGYLTDTADREFHVKGFDIKKGEYTEKSIPYIHRWTATYRQSLIAKLYKLEAALGVNYNNISMITLTVYQKGSDPEQCLLKLVEMRRSLLKLLRYHFGKVDYFWILENHKTGYPHLHIAYAKILSAAEQCLVSRIWTELYRMGSSEHGVKFSLPRASNDGSFQAGTVGRIRGYLLKYLKKGLGVGLLDSGGSPKKLLDRASRVKSMIGKNAMLLFNALLKKHNIRLWGCSRRYSEIMKKPDTDASVDWVCEEVSQYKGGDFVNIVWSKEGGLRPDIVKVWKYVLSVPMLFESDIEREKLGQIKVEDHPERVQRFSIFESVYVPVGCV